jgi:hypothetical protein
MGKKVPKKATGKQPHLPCRHLLLNEKKQRMPSLVPVSLVCLDGAFDYCELGFGISILGSIFYFLWASDEGLSYKWLGLFYSKMNNCSIRIHFHNFLYIHRFGNWFCTFFMRKSILNNSCTMNKFIISFK